MKRPDKICNTRDGWVNPKGRICLADLKLKFAVPPLYVHKSLSSNGWVVTEHYTGNFVGRGKTKKLAIENARERILKVGESNFKASISKKTVSEDKR